MLEELKAAIDGWYMAITFYLMLIAVLTSLLTRKQCGSAEACENCPWRERRRWYWRVRAWVLRLWVTVDALYLVGCTGRVVLDPLLDEVAWTWPLFGVAVVILFRALLDDLQDVSEARDRARELS